MAEVQEPAVYEKVSVTVEAEPWSAGKAYDVLTMVSHRDSMWITISDVPAGEEPSLTGAYYKLVATKGDKGDRGDPGPQGDPGQQGDPGTDGADGITPSIGANGNWFIGDTDTGIPAAGSLAEGDQIRITGGTNGLKTISVKQDASHRFITDSDKTKLDGIEAGAQARIGVPVYISDTAPSDTAGLWVQPPTE